VIRILDKHQSSKEKLFEYQHLAHCRTSQIGQVS